MTKALEELRKRLYSLPEGRCLAGFSGGADSTAMILMLAAERDAGRIQPEAVHVNHGLREAESDGDEAFCRKMCEKMRIPFHAERAELDGKSDENTCREARFRCFRKVMDETGIRTLLLAHNRDDLAETFLMRLIRGAGTEGLACMSGLDIRTGYTIRRPMLKMGRDEIRNALYEDGISWREDSLNKNGAYLRNRIRERLIPLMNELGSGAAERIAKTAELVTIENRMLQDMAESFLTEHADGTTLDADYLGKQPEAMRLRILRAWWKQNAPEMDEHALNAAQTEALAELAAAPKGKINLPGGLQAVKGRQGLHLTGFPKETPNELPFMPQIHWETVFGGLRLTVDPGKGNPGNGKTEQEVPEDFLRGCVIRTRRNGDRIRPFGMEGSRKLQDYLTDRGIDEPLRDRIPLVCRGNEVLLAAGIGAGAVPRWNAGVRNIRVKWSGNMPWIYEERKETDDG